MPGKSQNMTLLLAGCLYAVGLSVVSVTPTGAAPGCLGLTPSSLLMKLDLPFNIRLSQHFLSQDDKLPAPLWPVMATLTGIRFHWSILSTRWRCSSAIPLSSTNFLISSKSPADIELKASVVVSSLEAGCSDFTSFGLVSLSFQDFWDRISFT